MESSRWLNEEDIIEQAAPTVQGLHAKYRPTIKA